MTGQEGTARAMLARSIFIRYRKKEPPVRERPAATARALPAPAPAEAPPAAPAAPVVILPAVSRAAPMAPPAAPRALPAPVVFAAPAPPDPHPMPLCGPWSVGPHWAGETVFVVASGPSIADTDFELIRGRKIIAVNSSYERVMFADIVYFGDGRWWDEHKQRLNTEFKGRIATVTNAVKSKRFLKLARLKPESQATGYSDRRDMVASQRTSLQGALNLAGHLIAPTEGKAGNIILIGADMGRSPDGRSHGHKPHKWTNRPGNVTWDEQMRHLKWIVPHLQKRGIRVVNCSMESRIPTAWWPKMTLQEFLTLEKLARKGGWNWADKL